MRSMLKVNFKNAFKVILTWDFGNIFFLYNLYMGSFSHHQNYSLYMNIKKKVFILGPVIIYFNSFSFLIIFFVLTSSMVNG